MAKLTIAYGALLILLALTAFIAAGGFAMLDLTAAALGLIFIALGAAAHNEELRKHVMHAASALSLLAGLGTFRGLTMLPAALAGGIEERGRYIASALICVLSFAFLAFCIRSFVRARLLTKAS